MTSFGTVPKSRGKNNEDFYSGMLLGELKIISFSPSNITALPLKCVPLGHKRIKLQGSRTHSLQALMPRILSCPFHHLPTPIYFHMRKPSNLKLLCIRRYLTKKSILAL
jgi:hypothetical protein